MRSVEQSATRREDDSSRKMAWREDGMATGRWQPFTVLFPCHPPVNPFLFTEFRIPSHTRMSRVKPKAEFYRNPSLPPSTLPLPSSPAHPYLPLPSPAHPYLPLPSSPARPYLPLPSSPARPHLPPPSPPLVLSHFQTYKQIGIEKDALRKGSSLPSSSSLF
ncbi:hypothetical protein Pcinc_042222 [Petrolisthes cinctipes]|uniref:Uncharacterized protein n=1 Tax=Petrolisthes cinctipes TaxID=88211 RepID=A0AAE1BIQ6_PETCI|nr:hypothetical protein Pcinc_042222 [Petrolisthes cinctipes]